MDQTFCLWLKLITKLCAGHELKECVGTPDGQKVVTEKSMSSEVQFIFVRLFVLREYLEKELVMENLPFTYEFERAIDDWVFMCFFVGEQIRAR